MLILWLVTLLKLPFHLRNKNKTSVPVFYRGNKTWVRVRVRVN